jgi:ubiquinone/menaquinone biosynthesis C-methylase UbiE
MSRLTTFESAPMTGSSANYLAQKYGHGTDVDNFSEQLPQDARILDIGAGRSDLGERVAKQRPDIHWINFDIQYTADDVNRDLTPNLQFTQGDILHPPMTFSGRFDRIYSYNVLSHFVRFDRPLAKRALTSMVSFTKPEGTVAFGPTNSRMASDSRWDTVELHHGASEATIDDALDQLETSKLAKQLYDAMQQSGVGIFNAERFNPDEKGLRFSDDAAETLVKPFTREGLILGSRLLGGFIKRS